MNITELVGRAHDNAVKHGEQGVTIAADWDVLPPGTVIYIDGLGERVVQDRGGAIKGNAVDIYFEDHDEALVFGRQAVRLYIIEERREQS